MPLSAAERQRRLYRRRLAGRYCLPVEVELCDLAQALIDEGLIRPDQQDDKAAITAALEKVIAGLIVLTREGLKLRDWIE